MAGARPDVQDAEPELAAGCPRGQEGPVQQSPISVMHPTGCFRLCILTCSRRLHGSSGESARSLALRISSVLGSRQRAGTTTVQGPNALHGAGWHVPVRLPHGLGLRSSRIRSPWPQEI
jgi:hypothetical protein